MHATKVAAAKPLPGTRRRASMQAVHRTFITLQNLLATSLVTFQPVENG
jgi:hypothetical protein